MLPQVGAAQRLLDAVQTAPEPHSAPPHLHTAELTIFPAELVQSFDVAQMQFLLFPPHGTVESLFGLKARFDGGPSKWLHPFGSWAPGCWVFTFKLRLAAALSHIV